jgi:hypothetical protein
MQLIFHTLSTQVGKEIVTIGRGWRGQVAAMSVKVSNVGFVTQASWENANKVIRGGEGTSKVG